MDKIIVLGVSALVAVGTVLYYYFTKENEEPMGHGSGPRRPSPESPRSGPERKAPDRPRSPPVFYSDIKPKPCPKRKSVPSNESISKTYNPSEPDRESKENFETHRSPSPIFKENQNDTQPFHEITDNNHTISAVCKACDEPASVIFYPCEHMVFCHDDAKYFIGIFEKRSRKPKCPMPSCGQEILSF